MKAFLANLILSVALLLISSCSDKKGDVAETKMPDGMLQTTFGEAYYFGDGVEKDVKEAVKWYRIAAEKGVAHSQYRLGFCYAMGTGVEKDETEAVKWYRKAAEQGVADAQHNLGLCYNFGTGVAEDPAEAVKWYRKAAEQGVAEDQYSLGLSYAYGRGVEKDYAEAYAWINLAAVKYPDAAKMRAELEKKLTQEVIYAGQKRSKELREQLDARMKKGN